jgi:hypothetical protein
MSQNKYHCNQNPAKRGLMSADWFTILICNDYKSEQGKGLWRPSV